MKCFLLIFFSCAMLLSGNLLAATAVLKPGTGFTGPTTQPAQIGSGFGSSEKPMARWDMVPYEAVEDDFNVGVVAFHIDGIDRVEFSVDGGKWLAVRESSLNPQTGVVEYFVTLHPADFANDGEIELRAIVYPKSGVPRVLAGVTQRYPNI